MRTLHSMGKTFGPRITLALLLVVALVVTVVPAGAAWQSRATTERVSLASNGDQPTDGKSVTPVFSADGRYVAFYSSATDLVPGDTNDKFDVFVHDRQTGVTERVSVASNGDEGDQDSYDPCLSADGRYVVFDSRATNLVSGDTNSSTDIFVHDRQTGVTERVSVASNGDEGTGASWLPAFSADGRYVAFESGATNLVSGDTNGKYDVFVHDRQTGATERVSVASTSDEGDGYSYESDISADGRYVTFESNATDLVSSDTNGQPDVFVHDRQTGVTERVSVASSGDQATGSCEDYSVISPDGLYVAFSSDAADLVSGDTNGVSDIFVRNILSVDVSYVPVAGTSRYDTALKTSQAAFADGEADCVVIATGANWPDALGGAALAAAKNGPILLTAPTALTSGITDEIDRLTATEVYILGGTVAVSQEVEDALVAKMGASNVERIWGTSRYETAEEIAAATIAELEAGAGYDGTAFVATAANFPDALAASPLAATKGWPIFLCNPAGDPPTPAMSALDVTDALILGGTAVISEAQQTTLEVAFPGNVNRLYGANRYATGVAVATYGVETADLNWNGLAMSTGTNFPDA
ncbi:MAG: cell wall-binding repeat-containing protein, partial [Actinomycetota bacterium]|nr:cell wall-binding repeat-containing protein [Actinomycetota bacterium]